MIFDILIKNGLIVDGSGKAAYLGDVAVRNGEIVKIAPSITGEAKQCLDAEGFVVAPGFIDCHNHSDSFALEGSNSYNSLEQGVTTQITGHCGSSPAPYYEGALIRQKGYLPPERYTTMVQQSQTVDAFMQAVEQVSLGANMAFFVGHNNLRGKAMGFSPEAPTEKQMRTMQEELCRAMEAGCLGFSTGLIYAPSAYASTEELITLAKVMAPYDGIYASHIRGEGNQVVSAVEEAIRIGEEAGVQVQISHLKVIGLHNEGLSERLLRLIDDANDRGVAVYADQYPYKAGSAPLRSRIPPKYHAGGIGALLERLKDPATRREIEYNTDNFESCLHSAGYEGTLIASLPKTPELVGKTIGELAKQQGRAPVDVFCDILLANDGVGQGIYFNQSESDMLRILAHPRVFGGTDSANFPDERFDPASVGGRHPRGQATMVRRLELQRDHGLCMLEEAVYRVTGGPAKAFRLKNQGLLQEGFDANITIFDYAGLQANATYQHPYLPNKGIQFVLVNGVVAVENGRAAGIRAGKLLKRSK